MISAPHSQVEAAVSRVLGKEFLELIDNGSLLDKLYYTIKVRRWSEEGEQADKVKVSRAVQYMNIVFNLKRA